MNATATVSSTNMTEKSKMFARARVVHQRGRAFTRADRFEWTRVDDDLQLRDRGIRVVHAKQLARETEARADFGRACIEDAIRPRALEQRAPRRSAGACIVEVGLVRVGDPL